MSAPRRPLPRDVRALGLVSLFNDASSEMIFPLLPAFVTGVLRAGPAFLGLLEGLAESLSALLKLLAGRLSDRLGRRKPLVLAGYTLASGARPWVALAAAPWHVLAVRLADRVGKGLRSAPRDALLAAVAPPEERGRAFGFHRAMDHAGAMLGPLLASGVMALTGDLRLTFALAAVPAVVAVLVLALGVREPEPVPRAEAAALEPPPPVGAPVRAYLAVLTVFTLGNSSDVFLLLRAQEAGLSLAALPLLWSWHHAVKAATSTHGGALSDRVGRRRTILLGWAVYALTYAGFASLSQTWHVWALFGVYGLFHALTEGAEKALLADLAPAAARGTAFGAYHALTGAALLPASLVTGWLWQSHGAAAALGLGAALAGLAALGLLAAVPEPRPA